MVKGLIYSYGGQNVINGASFDVPKGTITGFLGPNGAGKTTTMFCITGALRPKGGLVRVFGEDPKDDRSDVKRRIAFVSERPAFYNHLTVSQNLLFAGRVLSQPAEETRKRVKDLSETLEFVDYLERKPWALSHGFRQRVAIAEALVGEPDLLILDEPTSGLDPASMIRIRDVLLNMNKQRSTTILLSSHNIHLLERTGDYFIFLKRGTVKASGTMDDLLKIFGRTEIVTVLTGGFSRELESRILSEFPSDVSCDGATVSVNGGPLILTKVLDFLISKGITVIEAENSQPLLEAAYMSSMGESTHSDAQGG